MTRSLVLRSLALAVLLPACAKGGDPSSAAQHMTGPPAATTTAAPAPAMTGQKLIRTGEMQVRVSDIGPASQRADSIGRVYGAFMADTRISRDAAEGREARLVFRVPSERFMETVAAFRRLGDVQLETVTTEDVTKAYADLETRLAVGEQAVARLRALLDARTAKLSDVLEVEKELARAITQVEAMKGERRYYDQRVAVSTLTLVLTDASHAKLSQLTTPVGRAWRGSLDVLGASVSALMYVVVAGLPWIALGLGVRWLLHRFGGRIGVRTPPARSGIATPPAR